MKTLQINTTQNVNIDFALANEMERVGAFLIDNVLKIGYLWLIYTFIEMDSFGKVAFDGWSEVAINIIICLPVIIYSVVQESLFNGQTLGKMFLKIRVVNIDGFKPSTADYLMRWFLRIIDFNLFFILIIYVSVVGLDEYDGFIIMLFLIGKCIGVISVAMSKKNQRIGDISANTVVISLKDKAEFSHTILENIEDSYKPKYPNVIKLSDNDARIIKDTFTAASKDKDYRTLIKLRIKIEEVTGIKSEEKTDIEFINKVLKDYNYYTQNM